MNDQIPESFKHHIVIVVKGNRWEAHGDPLNPLTAMVYQQLVEIGGINESVPDGVYYFNCEWIEGDLCAFTLDGHPNS